MLFIVALAGFSTVLAEVDYESDLTVYIKPNGVVVWTFPTVGVDWAYNGKDISEIYAQYWLNTGLGTYTLYDLTPTQIHNVTKSVDLIFKDLSSLPPPEQRTANDLTFVWGTLTDGKTFDAYGPGFTYRPH